MIMVFAVSAKNMWAVLGMESTTMLSCVVTALLCYVYVTLTESALHECLLSSGVSQVFALEAFRFPDV